MKNIIAILMGILVAITLVFTVGTIFNTISSDTKMSPYIQTSADARVYSETTYIPVSSEYDADDLNSAITKTEISSVILEGNSIAFNGSGATVEGTTITITSAGMYSIYGTLNDGQICVNTNDGETVRLVLNGVDISCSTSAPIYVLNAEKTIITLADGTKNSVTDGYSNILADTVSEKPNAAIFSKDDLTINGGGTLTVSANYKNGIQSKEDLKIMGGIITVTAVNDAIKGKDSVTVREGGNNNSERGRRRPVYSGGTDAPGSEVTNFTISGVVPYAGSSTAGASHSRGFPGENHGSGVTR